MNTMDCTDIKALLSAIVDDQIDEAARHSAERHLVECAACRGLVEEAERLDSLLSREGEAAMAAGLPEGFEARVLARTVHAEESRPLRAGWIAWSGWLAAAACLTLAATVWLTAPNSAAQDQFAVAGDSDEAGDGLPAEEGPATGFARAASYTTGFDLRSQTYNGSFSPEAFHSSTGGDSRAARASGLLMNSSAAPSPPRDDRNSDLSRLTRADTEALYTVSLLLDLLADPDLDIPVDIAQMQRAIEGDNLTERMGTIADQLEGRERRAVLRAELVIHRLATYDPAEGEPERLREVTRESRLPDVIGSIITRWDESTRL